MSEPTPATSSDTTSAAASPAPPPAAPPQGKQSPLTLIMKIKSPADYEQLNGMLRQMQSLPIAQNPIWNALQKIGTVHFARFVFLENNTRLAVITTYDGSFNKYINDFIDEIGDVFNALLAHMDGAPTLPVQANRDEFLDYVRANDMQDIAPFYSAYPTLTALDIEALAAQN